MLAAAATLGCDDGSGGEPAPDGGQPDAIIDSGAPDMAAEPIDMAADMPIDMADIAADMAIDMADMAPPRPYPAPGDWEPWRGPGAPAVEFAEEELYQNCAYIDVGPDDRTHHHNTVTMYDGYLLMPWAPEFGLTGGLTFFDISDPCAPSIVGHQSTDQMRESHTIGFSDMGGRWAVTAHQTNLIHGGVLFWDVSDPTAPQVISSLTLPGYFYPDSYARTVLSTFWQPPYVYVGGADNGVWIVDASDPHDPQFVHQHVFEPILRVGQVQVVGNLLVATAAEGTRAALLDVSDPAAPQAIPGGDFEAVDHDGEAREWYFSTLADGHLYLVRKEGGGGLIVYDIHDPTRPVFAGAYTSDRNGGYAVIKDGLAFVGESSAAAIYDVSDLSNITEVATMHLEGDLDTVTPIGNLAFPACDDKSEEGKGTAIAPYATQPDTTPPRVTWIWPPDGAANLPTTSRFGLMFNEFIAVKSAWAGSVRLYEDGTDPALTRVDGHLGVQENIVNFWPAAPLKRGTTYRLEVPAGGIADFNRNLIAEPFSATFTTVGAR